jgi:phospholipase/carboxylesterase
MAARGLHLFYALTPLSRSPTPRSAARKGELKILFSQGPRKAFSRELRRGGYNMTYREFEGKHTLPPEIAADALRWFMEKPRA